MRYLVLALCLLALDARADAFSARLDAGNKALKTPEGTVYEGQLGAAVGKAIASCVPLGTEVKAEQGYFALVGNVDAAGHLTDVEVQPANAYSRCFAHRLKASPLPAPPRALMTEGRYPLTVEMQLTH